MIRLALALLLLAAPVAAQDHDMPAPVPYLLNSEVQGWWCDGKFIGPSLCVLPDGRIVEMSHIHFGSTVPFYQPPWSGAREIFAVRKLHNFKGYCFDANIPGKRFLNTQTSTGDWLYRLVGNPFGLVQDRLSRGSINYTRTVYPAAGWYTNVTYETFCRDTANPKANRAVRLRGSWYRENGVLPTSYNVSSGLRAFAWLTTGTPAIGGRSYQTIAVTGSTVPKRWEGAPAPVVRGLLRLNIDVAPSINLPIGCPDGTRRCLDIVIGADPDFHNPDVAKREGLVFLRRNFVKPGTKGYALDTAKLSEGPHKIYILAHDSAYTTFGVLTTVLTFDVVVAR